jgi:hypothetical protein
VDPAKVESLLSWKQLINESVIQSFIGLAGYYRLFIECFSRIARPLTQLIQKENKFEWTPVYETSFQEFKRRLTYPQLLILLDIWKDFEVYCDAFKQGLGCVLMQ